MMLTYYLKNPQYLMMTVLCPFQVSKAGKTHSRVYLIETLKSSLVACNVKFVQDSSSEMDPISL